MSGGTTMSDAPTRRIAKRVEKTDEEIIKAVSEDMKDSLYPNADDKTPPPKYEPTDEQLFSSKKNYDAASESLLTFVEEQISKMKGNILFDEVPSFWQLNSALASYESILFALLSSYAAARMNANIAQELYDDKWANVVVQTKTKFGLNKYVSGKEIEYLARSTNMEELSRLKADVIRAENERSFMERMVEGWRQYAFVLSRLSANAECEARASKLSTTDAIGNELGE
jgi:hypothetical protein